MIILDTNVISEIMKPNPSISVMNWFEQQDPTELYISTITIAEIFYGINVMPKGSRRQSIEVSFEKTIKEAFRYRVWPFDQAAAFEYGKIMGYKKQIGKTMSLLDGQIASIARSNDAAIATRNIKDFLDCGIELINPFKV